MANRTALYQFGPYQLDPAKRLLIRNGTALAIAPKTFDLLQTLVEGRGRVFTKKELMSTLWPDSFVEEANLAFQISTLRKVLGDSETDWIETLPRYGYRFSSNVAELDLSAPSSGGGPPAPGMTTSPVANGHSADGLSAEAPVLTPTPVPQRHSEFARRRNGLYWIPAIVSTAAAVALGALYLHRSPPGERVVRFSISPANSITMPDADPITVSPDGERLAFIGVASDGSRQVWVRALNSLTTEPLASTDRVESAFWSPDGRALAFFAGGKLKKLDLQSGAVQTICNTPVGPEIGRAFGTWNSSGVILFATTERPEIYRVAAGGGEPKPITTLDMSKGETRHSAPQFLPDGDHFIYFVQSNQPEKAGTYVASLGRSVGQRLLNSSTRAVYGRSARGVAYLLFTQGTNLMAQAFNPTKLELTGSAFPVAQNILVAAGGIPLGGTSAAISASANGVLAYRAGVETNTRCLCGWTAGAAGWPEWANPATTQILRSRRMRRSLPLRSSTRRETGAIYGCLIY